LGEDEAKISAVLPDWQGRLWFVTRWGVVGTVDPQSGHVESIELTGEEIQNSHAVDEEAVYVLSDHALYRFEADPTTGKPQVVWREVYDRGTAAKPGMIHHGSGTTPTLLGDDYVAIADNAEPQINLLIHNRGREVNGRRLVCQQPLFTPGASATENSLVGYGRSIIVENNYGYDIFPTMTFGRTSEAGLVRVDVDEDGEGCHVVWQSSETSQTVVHKLSAGNGLLYAYTKDPNAPAWIDAYYLTAIDFRTGQTVFKVLTGTGVRYDNNYSPITIGPDGTAYVGTLNGLVAVRDRPSAAELSAWRAFHQQHAGLLCFGLMLVSVALVLGVENLWNRLRKRAPMALPPPTA
jgi:outer membrane protein assembly factor BamB